MQAERGGERKRKSENEQVLFHRIVKTDSKVLKHNLGVK